MTTSKKQKKLTVIVIQDERRLFSFKFPMSFFTICLVAIIGVIIISFTAVMFHNQAGSLNKEEFTTTRVEPQPKPSNAKDTESEVESSHVNISAQTYSLSIENFKSRFDLTKQFFRYTFLLKNKNSKSTTVSGYIFVILKSEGLGSEYWLVHPQTILSNGVPQNFRDGDPFSITKHKVINKNITTQYLYDICEIFVFSNEGNIILREIFNLKH